MLHGCACTDLTSEVFHKTKELNSTKLTTGRGEYGPPSFKRTALEQCYFTKRTARTTWDTETSAQMSQTHSHSTLSWPAPKPTSQKGTTWSQDIPSPGLYDDISVSYPPNRVQFSKSRENPFQENKHSWTTVPFCYLFGLHNYCEVKTFILTRQKELWAHTNPATLFFTEVLHKSLHP
jgi:hypothetical protein